MVSSSWWRGYAAYFRPHRAMLAAVTVAGLAQSFFYLPFAWLLRRLFDVILPARDLGGLWTASLEILALQMAGLGLAYWVRVTSLRISEGVVARIRAASLERLYQLPRGFYTAADLEKLHVTLVYESNWVGTMTRALTGPAVTGALGAAMLFAIMFVIQPRLALVIVVAAPAVFIVNRLMTRRSWFRLEALRVAFENFSRGVRFVLAAMDLTRAQAAEAQEMNRQRGNIEELRRIAVQLNRFDAGQELMQGALIMAATLAVLIAGGYAVAQSGVTRGEMMAFYVMAAMFAAQTRTLLGAMPEIRMGMRGFRDIHALFEREEREPYSGTRRVSHVEEIRLDEVHFAYPGRAPLLEGVSLSIPRGGRVVLFGANGSGKTSIVHLIGGYYRPDRGRLRVNGTDYEEIDVRSLRARTAVVPQNPLLFGGTLGENLLYGCDEEEGAIEEALEGAGLREFVEDLPEGLKTAVGDQGIQLSGGQRQRLAIARALLRRPDLLIFDEPTNHLDEAAIDNLSASLQRLPYRPAVLLISHEPRILRHADVAWRLENGRLERAAVEARR